MENQVKKDKNLPKKPIPEAITIDDIVLLGNELKNPELRVLYYMLYLSAGRIGEVLNIRKKDIEYKHYNNKDMIIFSLITEKNKKHPIRQIPACYNDLDNPNKYKYEKAMVEMIKEYCLGFLDEELIFKTNRIIVWRRFTNAMSIAVRARMAVSGKPIDNFEKKINPHFLRHCRLTHLRKEYNADVITLMQVAGWTNTNPATTYLHIGYIDIAKMFDTTCIDSGSL